MEWVELQKIMSSMKKTLKASGILFKWSWIFKVSFKWAQTLQGRSWAYGLWAGMVKTWQCEEALKSAILRVILMGYIQPHNHHLYHVYKLTWRFDIKWTPKCLAKGLGWSWLAAYRQNEHKTSTKCPNQLKLDRGDLEHMGNKIMKSKGTIMHNP